MLLNEILARAKKEENEARYHKLILHTREVPGGERFIKDTERAKELLEKMSLDSRDESLQLEYRLVIRNLTAWLDENGWA